MMCLLGIPAFDHRVIAVALTQWLVYIWDNEAASLMLFIMASSVFTPSGRASNHTLSHRSSSSFAESGKTPRSLDLALTSTVSGP